MFAQSPQELDQWLGKPAGSMLTYQVNYVIGIYTLDAYMKTRRKKNNSVILNPRQFGLEIHVVLGVFKQFRFGLEYSQIAGWGITEPYGKFPDTLLIEYLDPNANDTLAVFLKCKNVSVVKSFMRSLPIQEKIYQNE